MSPTFDAFFQAATSLRQRGEATTPQAGNTPYDYQCRLACGKGAKADRPETLSTGTPCESRLIHIPTGLGKTAA